MDVVTKRKRRAVNAGGKNGLAEKRTKKRVHFSRDPAPHSGQLLKKRKGNVENAESSALPPQDGELPEPQLWGSKTHRGQRAPAGGNYRQQPKVSTKEKLATMNKQEKKAFIRSLEAKNKPNFHIAQQAKALWEKIRSSRTKAEEKEAGVAELRALVRGKAASLIYAHDTCRVIECLIALKREDIRNELFEELSGEVVPMTKSRYAMFFVAKMFKYGSKEQKDALFASLRGHCARMLNIGTAAKLLDTAYNDYANASQRNEIVEEFYGREYALLKHELDQGRDGAFHSLKLISKSHPTVLNSIVNHLDSVLEKAVRRETLRLSLTHRLLLDYLTHASAEQRKCMVESLKDHLPEIIHTREGSRAAMICIWQAEDEEKKAIVRSFKSLSLKAAMDEFGRRALFAIFDRVDDVELVWEFILKEISSNIDSLIHDKFGIWVLHYLVHPRDYRVFGKGLIELLRSGDSIGSDASPPTSNSYAGLFNHIRRGLYTYLAEHMRELIFDKISSVLILDALEPDVPSCPLQRALTKKERGRCFSAIAEIVAEEVSPDSVHITQAGCGRFVLRKLLHADAQQEGVKLSDYLAKLDIEQLNKFTSYNSGCFALLDMVRSGSKKARAKLLELDLSLLRDSQLIGAKLLYRELFPE